MKNTVDAAIEHSIDFVVRETVEYLLKSVTLLQWGPLPYLTTRLVEKVTVTLFYHGRLAINRAIIDQEMERKASKLNIASEMAREAVRGNDEKKIEEADMAIRDAARDLVSFSGKLRL